MHDLNTLQVVDMSGRLGSVTALRCEKCGDILGRAATGDVFVLEAVCRRLTAMEKEIEALKAENSRLEDRMDRMRRDLDDVSNPHRMYD